MPDVLRINKNLTLDTAMERSVLHTLSQCVGDQAVNVRAKDWRIAAGVLVNKGLAEEVEGKDRVRCYRITEAGRRAIRTERGGAE